MRKTFKVAQTFRIELSLMEKLEEEKERTNTSKNELVNKALYKFLMEPHIEPDIEAPNSDIEPPEYDQVTEGYNPLSLVPPKKEDPEQKKEEQTEETVSQYSKKLFEFDTKEFKF